MSARLAQLLNALTPKLQAALGSTVEPAYLAAFIARQREALEAMLVPLARVQAGASDEPHWFELYNGRPGVRREAQPAFHAAVEEGNVIFRRALALVNEPPSYDFDIMSALHHLGSLGYDEDEDEDEDEDIGGLRGSGAELAADLPLHVGTAALDWTAEETGDLLAGVMDAESRGGIRPDGELRRDIINYIYDRDRRLELLAIDKDTACAFIEAHHSALPYCNTKGLLYAIGAFLVGELVAVATANTPGGKWDPGGGCPVDGILDLTRIASIGGLTRRDRRGRRVPVNASSALCARLIKLLPESGRRGVHGCRFITYSLVEEAASTYLSLVALGLRPTFFRKGRKASGARRGSTDALAEHDKILWEAGPAARPPDWRLIAPERREGAMRAFAAFMTR